MLKSMRKHARFFYVLFIIVILSFIFWGVGTVDKSSAPSVAEIGKEKVTAEEYWRAYDQMRATLRETYKDQFNEEMEKKLNLKEVVLSSLIAEKVLEAAASDVGVTVSDQELQEVITHEPSFMRDGVFNRDIYFRVLQLQRQTPETFESSLRQQLIAARMRQLISSSVVVNPLDLRNISGDEKDINEKVQAIATSNRNAALASYVNGVRQLMNVKINTDLIS
ncbi:MAG TPA: SurA N-terminal domain-containing protein [Dissulfurispiraceae bacterium]|nr:SurA N-terminal domain-containing protein [Dissulfurispiraceae bacterium]